MNWTTIASSFFENKNCKAEMLLTSTKNESSSSNSTYLIQIIQQKLENIYERIGMANVVMPGNLHYATVYVYDKKGAFIFSYEDYSLPSSSGVESCLKRQAERIFSLLYDEDDGMHKEEK